MITELTFVGMGRRKDSNGSTTTPEMPGWAVIAAAIKDAVDTSGVPVPVIAERADMSRQYLYSMMAGTCNPTMDKVERVMNATGTTLKDWLDDKAMYGRDRRLHDQVQHILNERGTNAVALKRAIEALVVYTSDQANQPKK